MKRRAGLRERTMAAFALGGLLVSVVLTSATYLIARGYLVDQRAASAVRQSFADASFVRDGLLTAGASPGEVIGDISPRSGSRVLVQVGGEWYSSDLADTRSELPQSLLDRVEGGSAARAWVNTSAGPAIVTGTPLPSVGAAFYEVSTVEELGRTLDVLRTVLIAVGVVTAAGAAVVGRYAARRVLRPLDDVAAAATAIAAGRMGTRLSATEDPDLVAIVGSFNTMVDALAARIDRETRFTADVSHELRSPLTTLVTGVELLSARRDQLPERSQQALDLVRRELDRFRSTLEDLLELARLDADVGADRDARTDSNLVTLVRQVLADSGRDAALLEPPDPAAEAVTVQVNRRQVERALRNLLENAERHAGGVSKVLITRDTDSVYLAVDDAGSGVPVEDRERIFARFARSVGSRGSIRGTGLGLSLVSETAQRHQGSVWCAQSPAGGARFVLRLPIVLIVAVCVLLAGCGVPTGGETRTISAEDVPYGLLGERSTAAPGRSPAQLEPGDARGQVAFIQGDRSVRLLERDVPDGTPAEVAEGLLRQLQQGPSDSERRGGLESAISAGVQLEVTGLVNGVLTVDVSGEANPAPDRLPLAVAQMVLTATSVPGVRAVRLENNGNPVEVPLVDGSLSSAPLTRQIYQQLINAPQ